MFKIMLVEDEIWVRKGLKEQIDWSNLDAVLSEEASDGEEAYNQIKVNKPDIVLTDIKMPHMDGLTFMALINREFPDIKVIVISGYSEFELVKKAIIFKAINYILKPIDENELNLAISKAIDEIKLARSKIEENHNLKQALNQSFPALVEKNMNSVISKSNLTYEEFNKILSNLNIKFEYSSYQVSVIHVLNLSELSVSIFDEDEDLVVSSISNIIYETCNNSNNMIIFKNSNVDYEFIIIYGFLSTDENECDNYILGYTNSISENLNSILKANTKIGIGRLYEAVEGIIGSYNEAVHTLKELKYKNESDILFFKSLNKKNVGNDTMDKIIAYINSHYHEQLSLETIAEKFFLNSSYLSRTFKAETGDSFTNYITKIRIEKAKQLMLNNELKLQDISWMVGYENTNYFSKIFKKITGYSPTDYRNKTL